MGKAFTAWSARVAFLMLSRLLAFTVTEYQTGLLATDLLMYLLLKGLNRDRHHYYSCSFKPSSHKCNILRFSNIYFRN